MNNFMLTQNLLKQVFLNVLWKRSYKEKHLQKSAKCRKTQISHSFCLLLPSGAFSEPIFELIVFVNRYQSPFESHWNSKIVYNLSPLRDSPMTWIVLKIEWLICERFIGFRFWFAELCATLHCCLYVAIIGWSSYRRKKHTFKYNQK